MKRSELKPGKPLKAKTALKSGGKIKRKKKTALQKRIDKKDSKYWNRKCAEAVKEWAHRSPCLYCGVMESALPPDHYIAGHHLLRKSRSVLYRWHPMNIIPLCPEHHTSGIQVCAHSDNPIAVVRFIDWLKSLKIGHYDWLVDHQDAIRKTDMRGPIEHPDWRYQYEIWRQRIADAKIIRQEKP